MEKRIYKRGGETVIVNRAERHYIKKAHKNFKAVDDL